MAVPGAPDISVTQLSDTSFRVTFDGDAAVTNYVIYATQADGGDNWSDGGNRAGDGDVDVAGLVSGGSYYVQGYSTNADGKSIPSNIVELSLTGALTGKPTILVVRKRELIQRKTISEDRDSLVTQSIYNLGHGGTLAVADLEPGDTLPDNTSARIIQATLQQGAGTSEKQAVVVARQPRAYA